MVSVGSGQLAWRNGLGRRPSRSRIESALLLSINQSAKVLIYIKLVPLLEFHPGPENSLLGRSFHDS